MAIITPPPFKIGDSVILRSNSKPLMTVLITGDEKTSCIYYNPITGRFDKHEFPNAAIKKYVSV